MAKPSFIDPARDLVPWVCVSLVIMAGLLLDSSLSGIQLWPWLISVLVFGLPHGACDHLVAARLAERRTGESRYAVFRLAIFFLLYLMGGAVVVLLWISSPSAALVFFLVLAAWHWGSADAVIFGGSSADFAVRSTSRGLIVISAPIAFHAEASLSAFSSLLEVFGTVEAPLWLPSLATGCMAAALATAFLLAARDARRGKTRRAAREAVETALILALMYSISPVAAVGVYFLAWHSWRHVLRAGTLLDSGKAKDWPGLVASYHVKAMPLTLASVVALAILTLAAGWENPSRLVGLYLILLSALTAPHAAVMLAWDAREVGDGK